MKNWQKLRFSVDNIPCQSLLSKGIDQVHISTVDVEQDGVGELLIRYSKEGSFLKSAHILIVNET